MIQSLRTWPYLETAALALASGLFLHILDDKLIHGRLTLVFWTGFWCGSALTLVLLLIGFCILALYVLRQEGQSPRVDPNCRAVSDPRESILRTPQISGFQDGGDVRQVVVLNALIAALWLNIQKHLGVCIKNTVQGIIEFYATDASRHIGLRARTLLTFRETLDQVLCAAKKKLVLQATKRFTLKEVDLGPKPLQITEIRCQDGPDECAVEIGIRWEPEGAALKLSADLFGRPWVIQIKNMHLEGTIKLVLKPLRGDTSGFGAVLVSLKEDPHIDFDVDTGVRFIHDSLNLKKVIQESVASALMESIVWPRRFVFPVNPGEDVSSIQV